ncbi:M50 family metallopeptidase [Shewanella sp. C32]|uniref:M50 family metallopeptidase n=1 Tax=Shewanella electrica TaxID=515560 RepID=A0ABT2FLT6_9GAMM|nr:M50 family metallopeptidase [Shewanella electrica]MCH1923738.1 M50 family metallopeptidase [Shewanella electrica]MCS4556956.1 M50 family metallopeptidase [Shewanella electrica]
MPSSLPQTAEQRIPGRGQFIVELIVALILSRAPFISTPFKWLECYFHELSHALATLLSGGRMSHIELFSNGAGLCFSSGGWATFIGFSGYAGAAAWGALLYFLACSRYAAKSAYALMGSGVLVTMLLWGRDVLTIAIMLSLAVLFLLPLKFYRTVIMRGSLRLVALIVLLNALSSPAVLLGISERNDAATLADQTFIPAFIWVLLWFACGLLALMSCWWRINQARKNVV